MGALPCRLCASSDPSPVMTRSVPASLRRKSIRSRTVSIPGRVVAPSTDIAPNAVPPPRPPLGVAVVAAGSGLDELRPPGHRILQVHQLFCCRALWGA